MKPISLSKADSLVLAQVFDPESAPTKTEIIVDPHLPADKHVSDACLLAELRAMERQAILCIEECERSKAGPAGREAAYESALVILDQLIAAHPKYASARNNRAQLRRWRFGDRNTLCQKRNTLDQQRTSAGTKCVDDLQQCIKLASPTRPTDAVSPSQGQLLGQAYTQLAALYYAASKDLDADDGFELVSDAVQGWSRDKLEEEGSRCFYMGGLFGNEVAKALAVHTNPHAKLCGSIVKEAMRNEIAASLM